MSREPNAPVKVYPTPDPEPATRDTIYPPKDPLYLQLVSGEPDYPGRDDYHPATEADYQGREDYQALKGVRPGRGIEGGNPLVHDYTDLGRQQGYAPYSADDVKRAGVERGRVYEYVPEGKVGVCTAVVVVVIVVVVVVAVVVVATTAVVVVAIEIMMSMVMLTIIW